MRSEEHIMTDILIIKNNDGVDAMRHDRYNHVTSTKLIEEAWTVVKNEYGDNLSIRNAQKDISENATKTESETISEALVDIFSNGENAKLFSKAIIGILDERTR
ncbi:MAG: hypothetical protein FWH48_04370 [Oscillospiraceae bacterium]|nr:hypothetical protein [Oscillospiraceae bacterium]